MSQRMSPPTTDRGEFVALFDGTSLDGWHAVPHSCGSLWPGGPEVRTARPELPTDDDEQALAHPAHWEIVDGTIEGFQDPARSGYGGYLVTDRAYADFELQLELNPDWPADTGVMLRRRPDSWHGFQVLVDHRKSGSIGGFFGNGTGSFHAVPFVLDVVTDRDDVPTALVVEDPATTLEPMTPRQAGPWVNDIFVAEIDLATLQAPHYDADRVAAFLGRSGHLAREVHDNDPRFGEGRRGRGARCRWRNIMIKSYRWRTDHAY